MEELKRSEYFKSINNQIVIECLKNKGIGYLTLCINEDLNLVENSMRFIEGPIDTEQFINWTMFFGRQKPGRGLNGTLGKAVSGFYIYYSIVWYNKDGKTATLWNLKEFIEFQSSGNFWE